MGLLRFDHQRCRCNGALARQLQMQLADNLCTRGRVFIDSDELQNLDTLFEYAQREW